MTGLIQTFRSRAKRLILGLLILILYGEGLLAFVSMQREPSISVFLAGAYPDQEQVEAILDTEEKKEKKTAVCFYWDGGIAELTDIMYGRTARALLGGLYGDAGLYDPRLNGFAGNDKTGCVIDEKTSAGLFGTRQGEGRSLSIQGREYVVRKVLPWKQQMILIRPDQEENVCTRLFLEAGGGSREAAARQFLLSSGLTGTIAGGDFLRTAAAGGLALFPGALLALLLGSALRERKGYTEKEAGFWIWTAAAALLLGVLSVFLWNKIEIPRDWIPGQWSDFTFWQEKIQTGMENLRLYLMLPKTVPQTENILLCFQSLIFSLSSFFLSFFWKRV